MAYDIYSIMTTATVVIISLLTNIKIAIIIIVITKNDYHNGNNGNNNNNNNNNNDNSNSNNNNINNCQSSAMISGAFLFLSTFLKLKSDALHFCEQLYRPAFMSINLSTFKFAKRSRFLRGK